jgi:multidrug efflux pump subunit AcrA (membrane-fusion protein)
VSASHAAASETLAVEPAAATTAIVKKRRRWWIIAIFAIAVAAAAAGWYFWFGRNTAAAVHYLTATASTGTIAQTVQADFTLGSTNGVTTIALGGSSASSSSGSSSTSSTNSASSSSSTTSIGAVAGLASSRSAAVSSKRLTTYAAMSTGGAGLADVAAPTITALIPTYGPVGSNVTLIGSGFTGATAVDFNGRAATLTVNSDTQITATVPSGATSGPVTVTAPGGTATSAASFTVKPTVKPTPSSSSRPSPTSTSSRTGSGGGSASGSASGSVSSGTTSSGSNSSASSALSGVVTHIWLRAGTTPHTLRRLLTVSGRQVYAFVSPTPLWKNLSTNLSSGAQQANVVALQRALKKGGYYTGSVNGSYTSATATAYKSWQADRGMSKTGVVSTDRFVWIPKGSIITSWSVNLGDQVSSGTALASVVAPNQLSATALVSQADIASLKVGRKAQMTIDGYSGDAFTGTITYISSQPSSSSSSSGSSGSVQYSITIRPRELPKVAKSGMTGTLEIVIAQRKNVLLVPTSAVSGTSSLSYVRVMMDGKPVYRQVQTGMATSSYTQITSGLTTGEVVVTGQYTNNATSGSSTGTNGSSGRNFFRQGGSFPQGGFPQGGLPGGGQ